MISRIAEFIDSLRISVRAFEQQINASNGLIRKAITNNTDIQSKWLLSIAENYPQLDMNWLLTGEGSMIRSNVSSLRCASTMSTAISDNDLVSIPLVEISVAAGCGGYDNPDYLDVVDTIKMPSTMVQNSGRYFCIRVKGESMTPTILDSSYIIARLLDRSEWRDMPDRHVYIVSDRDGRSYIKRIKNRLSNSGFIVCTSDNVDKLNYPNFNLEEQELNTILHAEWYFSAKMPNLNETYYDKVNQLEDKYDTLENQMKQVLRVINAK